MNAYTLCIASKGRAGQSKTIATLIQEGVEFNVFVEPQEKDAYECAYKKSKRLQIHVLPENDRGITYVRNFILNTARKKKWSWFWMLDDDISGAFRVENKRCIKTPLPAVLRDAEQLITNEPGVGLGALEYQQYAWSATSPKKFNSYCDVAVLISVEQTKFISYRDDCKEDRDFVLQALSTGLKSMRTSWLAVSVPKNGSNAGGLHDAYRAGLEQKWSQRMVELWPGVCVLNFKKDGRPDVKIHWKVFKK